MPSDGIIPIVPMNGSEDDDLVMVDKKDYDYLQERIKLLEE